jgi:hypothetical protein
MCWFEKINVLQAKKQKKKERKKKLHQGMLYSNCLKPVIKSINGHQKNFNVKTNYLDICYNAGFDSVIFRWEFTFLTISQVSQILLR